jgi:hypothetical protein
MKIGKDVLSKHIKERIFNPMQKRTGDWHVIFYDLSAEYPKIINEVVRMEEAPTSRHAVAIAMKRLKEAGKRGKFKSVGFVDR